MDTLLAAVDSPARDMPQGADTLGQRMAGLISPLANSEGFIPTGLPGVQIVASQCGHPRTPLIYEPSLIVIAQGRKIGYLEDRVIHYGAGNYLIQALPLPFECETYATPDQPLLGVSIAINRLMLDELVRPMQARRMTPPARSPLPMAAVPMNVTMGDAVLRLLDCLSDPLRCETLGPGRIREVMFEALRGPQGDSLWQLLQDAGKYSRIADALAYLHRYYAESISVERLANEVNMSPSHFHHHFKNTTQLAPMQYLKRLRLLKARVLLGQRAHNVNRTAAAVGYQSPSQFSRDYKRYFGNSPAAERAS
ncbi:AraC family transcriptional regulator [Modicisalibacter luteus]|uniref:AraC family transcriptional regulator N-terminal domain-containing protein n=1 Tax=Modicisalibacter luteus TaxID=453962 RepID=A0ABV7M689_9GAMM|nr:AraC family transcriptional regulator [Halomonas lutea]GHA99494.1 AraC family transcriptional regulator [Halomonas lutea]